MSQHDLTIANQGFPAFRADLNSALQALGSCQSGTSAPSPTFANQLWYDTTNNILKIRNEDNDAWISVVSLDQTTDSVTAIGSLTLADIVSLTGSQTLTNKTLTAPKVNVINEETLNSGVTVDGVLLKDNSTTSLKNILLGSTSGSIELSAPAIAGSNTVNLPASSGTLALTSQIPNSFTRVVLTSGTSWTVPTGVSSINVLVIGAGGGGAPNNRFGAGGAGGGGFQFFPAQSVTAGSSISYSIGAGGALGSNGGSTIWNGQTALGGEAGANSDSTTGGFSGIPARFRGGDGVSAGNGEAGGGGGGAGGDGGYGAVSYWGGRGGNGFYLSINGINYWYGGGGGGGGALNTRAGLGGLGGGGNGATSWSGGSAATSGEANTGGGGGGGGGGNVGATGGSGVIVIWY